MIQIRVADVAAVHRVVTDKLSDIPAVRATETVIVLDEVLRRPYVLPPRFPGRRTASRTRSGYSRREWVRHDPLHPRGRRPSRPPGRHRPGGLTRCRGRCAPGGRRSHLYANGCLVTRMGVWS
ncbi:Lrp/AsnC ligand binding domain-containing protein [Streptomyces adustus]|uniref:Lrp/AsnC ligand binding domain-containing protein n=1 Tax=Streptomyces adustus TaxID=1609272 RepID=UPI003718E542